jgi:hypothetical protein
MLGILPSGDAGVMPPAAEPFTGAYISPLLWNSRS